MDRAADLRATARPSERRSRWAMGRHPDLPTGARLVPGLLPFTHGDLERRSSAERDRFRRLPVGSVESTDVVYGGAALLSVASW